MADVNELDRLWTFIVLGFYELHPDLKGHQTLVQSIFEAHFHSLKDLPVTAAFIRLGELTRERLRRYVRQQYARSRTAAARTAYHQTCAALDRCRLQLKNALFDERDTDVDYFASIWAHERAQCLRTAEVLRQAEDEERKS